MDSHPRTRQLWRRKTDVVLREHWRLADQTSRVSISTTIYIGWLIQIDGKTRVLPTTVCCVFLWAVQTWSYKEVISEEALNGISDLSHDNRVLYFDKASRQSVRLYLLHPFIYFSSRCFPPGCQKSQALAAEAGPIDFVIPVLLRVADGRDTQFGGSWKATTIIDFMYQKTNNSDGKILDRNGEITIEDLISFNRILDTIFQAYYFLDFVKLVSWAISLNWQLWHLSWYYINT